MSELNLYRQANASGSKVAFISASPAGGDDVTYAEIMDRSAALASALLKGERDLNEARIAFAAPAGPEYAIIQWGIWRAGGVALPLNLSATQQEMQHCLDTASISQMISPSEASEKITTLCRLNNIPLLRLDDVAVIEAPKLPQIDLSRRAMIIFTSGTTNKPKGVVTTHMNIQAQVETLVKAWRWQSDDVIPLFLPMHHVHGIINVMTCALYAGATIESYSMGFDMRAILQRVAEGAYSLFMAVPTIYVKIIQALEAMPSEERGCVCEGFKAMRLMISGSAALPIKVHQEWQALTGQTLLERYGMTEIGMALSNPMTGERRPGSVGEPLDGVQIKLVSETGHEIDQEDQPGEIWVKGNTVFLEYWDNLTATRESFRGGWFRTGDMAVLERGYYRIMGRLSVDIIKSGGYKISALEIENDLLAHDHIPECAVVGVEDDTWGEVVAVAIGETTQQAMTIKALQEWCKDRMSDYKIPRKMIAVDSLPRNAMGKVVKAEVKKLFT